jgi:glucose/arabinose dehydrogenase
VHPTLTRRTLGLLAAIALLVAIGGQAALAHDQTGSATGRVAAPESRDEGLREPLAVGPVAAVSPNVHLTFRRVARGLSQPVFVTQPNDGQGRLFIVEQTGRIRVISKGVLQTAPFLDLRAKVSTGGERGLLGLAFHPDYRTNGKFYVNYTDRNGNTVVEQYVRSATNARRASTTPKLVLRIGQPFANHNGGMLAFGPDRLLYIGMGDGGSGGDPGNRAQNLDSLLGKLLRINVDTRAPYAIPSSNPYVGKAGNDLIWSSGLRNPWRFSFDRATGDLWIGDVGQGRIEEIDRSLAPTAGRGLNYGWRVLEGNQCFNPSSGCSTAGMTMPLATYNHSQGCSVTGGYVYRGTTYPDLRGVYLFGDYCSGIVWGLDAAGPNTQTPVKLYATGTNISSFGEDQAGNLYLVDRNGSVWRVQDS